MLFKHFQLYDSLTFAELYSNRIVWEGKAKLNTVIPKNFDLYTIVVMVIWSIDNQLFG